jgi:hypothetical protein
MEENELEGEATKEVNEGSGALGQYFFLTKWRLSVERGNEEDSEIRESEPGKKSEVVRKEGRVSNFLYPSYQILAIQASPTQGFIFPNFNFNL